MVPTGSCTQHSSMVTDNRPFADNQLQDATLDQEPLEVLSVGKC